MLTANAPILIAPSALTFQRDLPGFRGARHFKVEPLGGSLSGIFANLCCTDTVYLQDELPLNNLVLLTMSPGALWPDYEVHVEDEMVDQLEIREPDDVALLVIVHPQEPLINSTVNLYSPIVYNRRTGAADQLVPSVTEEEFRWSLRTPFPKE